ncbi:MAG: hypothetical protein Q7J98_01670 [Kiritimatiellia bacterium]|nr:hypothetical protein [Kiritimatiellia bacterium]
MRDNPNSGVALILVLGLLTVMIIMAVTFAISMRTERLAAGNYADNVRARELVQAGLARAMNDLAANLGTSGLFSAGVKSAYPNWNVTNSYYVYTNVDSFVVARWNTNVYLLATDKANEATNYVPRALWTAAINADNRNPSNHWLPIESLVYTNDGVDDYLAESNLMGRVAYLIINCSGLLDANYVGGATRQSGTNPAEIAIGNLGEIGGNFFTDRGTAVRYETMEELNALADINRPATNLFVYSRALPGDWYAGLPPYVGTQVNLSGSMADLISRENEIKNAFERAFPAYESGVLYSNLIDYVDTNTIPQSLEYCVENVPMINEVVISNHVKVVTLPGPTYQYIINGAVYIECWYPFVSNANEAYNLNSSVTFAGSDVQPADLAPLDSPLGTPPSGSFTNIQRSFSAPPFDSGSIINPVRLVATITLSVKNTLGLPVDQVNTFAITINNDGTAGADKSTWTVFECCDPRFNLNPSDANQWRAVVEATPTLGSINTWATDSFSTNNDNDSEMFVANRPLRSVAELGCLVYSSFEPWKTIKLYGPNRHRALDVFGLSTNVGDVFMSNTVFRGLVNCNSNAALNASAAVFAGMPVDQYPGGPVTTVSLANARMVASNIFNGGFCTNLSDIGQNINNFPGATTELARESYFRNSVNLFNLRQNMFTIIIEAQAASGGNLPRNPAKQRAVAIVWRDPYTGEMFVRHIRWLGD